MTELVMTVIFFYSVYRFAGDYPLLAISMTICYLSSLSAFVYMTFNH